MGKEPTKAIDNIYCKCRKSAAKYNDTLNSREGAAELLGVSVSSLADYELGNTKIVPVDKVVLMADLYNAPELSNNYCANECPIGCRMNVPTEIFSLAETTVKLLSAFSSSKIENFKSELLDISEDGKIDENERVRFDNVVGNLDKISKAIGELQLLAKKLNVSKREN